MLDVDRRRSLIHLIKEKTWCFSEKENAHRAQLSFDIDGFDVPGAQFFFLVKVDYCHFAYSFWTPSMRLKLFNFIIPDVQSTSTSWCDAGAPMIFFYRIQFRIQETNLDAAPLNGITLLAKTFRSISPEQNRNQDKLLI